MTLLFMLLATVKGLLAVAFVKSLAAKLSFLPFSFIILSETMKLD
jgi:hypothetical protein